MRSVTDILGNFRRALVALTPMADEAGVTWRDGESYDEWDNVAQAVFRSFVVDVLQLDASQQRQFAEYDMRYSDYSELNRIFVKTPSSPELFTFVAFSTKEAAFDSVRITTEGLNDAPATIVCAQTAEFFVGIKGDGGN